jgi:hypothetical protein
VIVDATNDLAAAIVIEETGGNPTDNSESMQNKVRTLRARADHTLNRYIRTKLGVDPEADVKKGTVLGAVHVASSQYMTDEMQSEWGQS